RASKGTCHLMGLVSPGGVHSHQDHAAALARILHEAEVPTVVHAFTDGRDTPPQSAADDLNALRKALPDTTRIATVIGRYFAQDGDGILCFNFRADRVREILAALLDPAFDGFPRARVVRFAGAVGMTRYSDALAPFLGVLFPPEPLDHILGQVVAEAGKTQLRTAETEKYPHVTYFLNGGQEIAFPGEDRIMVPSPK